MRCPTCGRFISEEHPCSNCWTDMGMVEFEDYDPAWKRFLRFLKSILCIGGN